LRIIRNFLLPRGFVFCCWLGAVVFVRFFCLKFFRKIFFVGVVGPPCVFWAQNPPPGFGLGVFSRFLEPFFWGKGVPLSEDSLPSLFEEFLSFALAL